MEGLLSTGPTPSSLLARNDRKHIIHNTLNFLLWMYLNPGHTLLRVKLLLISSPSSPVLLPEPVHVPPGQGVQGGGQGGREGRCRGGQGGRHLLPPPPHHLEGHQAPGGVGEVVIGEVGADLRSDVIASERLDGVVPRW